jgi:RNA polymerase sigma factor (sigma-70 family)
MGALQSSLSDLRLDVSGLKLHSGVRRGKVERVDSCSSRLPSSGGTIRSRSVREEWDLIQHAITGEPSSQDRLFAAHANRLYRTALAVLRNKEDAEDAVQDALCSAYIKLRSFQGRSSFSTWLTRIVINSALMTRRRQQARKQASLDQILDSKQGRLQDGIVDRRPSPEEICRATEINRLVEEEIHRLPMTLQTAFRLCDVEGSSSEESSRAIGIPERALKSRLCRARKKLTHALRRSLRPPVRMVVGLVAIPILIAGLLVSVSDAQQLQTSTKAMQLTGLIGVKDYTRGSLTTEHGNLRFIHSGSNADLAPSSMQDVVTGNGSQRVIRGTVGTLSLFAPYGSGRFLSLFRSKLDTLTIQYRDGDGGLHGVIFTTPVGTADVIKNELIGLGAHTSIPTQGDPTPDNSAPTDTKELPLRTQGKRPAKINASEISVMMIRSDGVRLPAEFQVSLYENLIQQLQKNGGFHRVYREGDRSAADVPNLIVLHSSVRGFKQGSEMAREVTTVAGATYITVHCEFADKDDQLLLARDIKGKVRFFGGNLKATYDFAKKAASVAHENVSPSAGG